MSSDHSPLVSIAIPLFKSWRFLDWIIENIEAIEYPHVEIIVSDRHCADETIDFLCHRFENDPRFRFIKSHDQLNWVDHYNFLLGIAAGKYFLWMPHDDSYPSNYIPELVSSLEERPEAILAFGRMEVISLDGTHFSPAIFSPPPLSPQEPWSPRAALRLLIFWNLGIPFRGIFRRDLVVKSGLYIRSTFETVAADVYWVFGLALKGRLCFVPSCYCQKRLYLTSTHAQWRIGVRHVVDSFFVLRSYLLALSSSRRDAFGGILIIFFWTLFRVAGVIAPRVPIPRRVKRLIRKLLQGLFGFTVKSVVKHENEAERQTPPAKPVA